MRSALLLFTALMLVLAACSGGDDEGANDAPAGDAGAPAGDTSNTGEDAGDPLLTQAVGADVAATDAALGEVVVGEEGIEFGDPIVQPNATAAQVAPDFEPLGLPGDPEVLAGGTAVPLFDPNASSEGALPPAGPGTLVASETEDPEPIGPFQLVRLRQQGGRGNITTVIEIYADGRIVRDGEIGTVDAATIGRINQMIDDMGFFSMQGTYIGPPGADDTYTYRVYVDSGDIDRAINAQDGYLPQELTSLLATITNAAANIQSAELTPEPAQP